MMDGTTPPEQIVARALPGTTVCITQAGGVVPSSVHFRRYAAVLRRTGSSVGSVVWEWDAARSVAIPGAFAVDESSVSQSRGGGLVVATYCSGAVTDTADCGCAVALVLLLFLLAVGFPAP